MTDETRRRAEDCPPYPYRFAGVRAFVVGRGTPCAPRFNIRHLCFVIWLILSHFQSA
jgi:hypothetical protein